MSNKPEHKRVTSNTVGDSLTKQSFAPEADANNIVNRHMRGSFGNSLAGIGRPGGQQRQPVFMDVGAESYHEMLNRVIDIDNAFKSLPARLRTRFRNDPYHLIRFVENPDNIKESLKLGLIAPPEGYVVTETGELVEQMNLVKAAAGVPPTPPATPNPEPPKAP